MVTIVAGAVAVGLVSVCAIPLGCFISRKMKRRVRNDRRIARNESESKSETEVIEAANAPEESQPGCVAEEPTSGSDGTSVQRFEVRVFISSGSASGSVNFGPREAEKTPPQDSALRRLDEPTGSETTRLEITISGGSAAKVARFFEFKNGLRDATSTPKRKKNGRRIRSWNPWNRSSVRDPETTGLESTSSKSEPSLGDGGATRDRLRRALPSCRFFDTPKDSSSFASL